MNELREAMLAGAADPILTFAFIMQDLGISNATFHRGIRHELPIIRVSERRLGVRRSDYERWKLGRTTGPTGRNA